MVFLQVDCILALSLSSLARRLPRTGTSTLYICPLPDPHSQKREAYVHRKEYCTSGMMPSCTMQSHTFAE